MKRVISVVAVGLCVSTGAWARDAAEPSAEDQPAAAAEETEAAAEEPAAPAAVRYTLDVASSFLAVVVYKDPNTLGAGMAHDHTVVASSFDGAVTWSTTDASLCDVKISFPVSALTVDPGNARSRVGIDPGDSVSDGNKATIVSNFSGKGQLHVASFPTISFQSTSCTGTTGEVKVTGDLTIRGVSKEVAVTMDVSADDSGFSASGTFDSTHTDFGFNPFSAAFGALKNQNKLRFVVDMKGSASG